MTIIIKTKISENKWCHQNLNLWCKVIKTSIGATFNVKTEICEIILGLPPLELFNGVNTIKHFMKLNIKKSDNDPLRDSMLSLFCVSWSFLFHITITFVKCISILHWKLCHHAVSFTTVDSHIEQWFHEIYRIVQWLLLIYKAYDQLLCRI